MSQPGFTWQTLGGIVSSRPTVSLRLEIALDLFPKILQRTLFKLNLRSYKKQLVRLELHWWNISFSAAVSWDKNRIDVVALGLDNSVQHRWFDGTNWSEHWESLG
jgi:hypothetical protein